MNGDPVTMISEPAVRGTALLVFTTAAACIVFQLPMLFFLLAADFLVRAAGKPAWSLLTRLSSLVVVKIIPFKKRMIYAPPKRFAAAVGAFISAAAAISSVFGTLHAAYVLAGILMLFSFLEAVFKFCAGCAVYEGIRRLTGK